MVGFSVIWLLGWVCGGFSFGFVTDFGGYMVLVLSSGSVLILLFLVFGGDCCCCDWWFG